MRRIAIITARGGSKRIPGKNVKEFCGKPIIEYSIESALNSKLFDEIMVSTDSTEIAEISKRYGANVPFLRSARTSNDYATTYDVLEEVIAEYEKRGELFEEACCIYPTAPFVTHTKLVDALTFMHKENADSIMPVVKFSYPPQRALLYRNNLLKFGNINYINARSQDLEPVYHDCGQFYVFNVSAFKKSNSMVIGKCVPYFVKEEECQDIDNISDWRIAEIKYILMLENSVE